mgnify:CR=1 FL=1
MLKRIPVAQIDYIMSLEGFVHAKDEVEVVNNYISEITGKKPQDKDQDDSESLQSREAISVGNFIFTENILTYDTFLSILDDTQRKSRKQSLDNMLNEASTQDPHSKNSSNHTGGAGSNSPQDNTENQKCQLKPSGGHVSILEPIGVEANPNYIDSLLVLTRNQSIELPSELPFIVQVERINEILLRVITGKTDGQHPAFDFQKMMLHMVDMSKYTAFKKLVSQTAHVLKTRTSHYPSMVRTMSKPQTHEVVRNEIAMEEEFVGEDPSAEKNKQTNEGSDEFFNEGLRIIMYDKIIKSGFNHLSIFLDDFNYIYNEVITSTNNDLGGENNFGPDKLDL